jgi:hypothetical protein
MRSTQLLKFSRLFVMSTLLLVALLFCQFLGLKHSIVHGFSNTHSTMAVVAPSSNIRSDNFLHQQPSPVEHHCCAWDHATLSIGAISTSSPSFFVQTTFELKAHRPSQFFYAPPLFSYLSRAPPLPA